MPEILSDMGEFPFPFYIILVNVNVFPGTLGNALGQWV